MNKKLAKKWVQSWKQTEHALLSIKKQELANYNYSKNRIFIDQMLQWASMQKEIRLWSGLIDQQKYFIKLLKNHKLGASAH